MTHMMPDPGDSAAPGPGPRAGRSPGATARVNVGISPAGSTDEETILGMIAATGQADDVIARAGRVTGAVGERIRA
jgi:hypothetical protein